MIVKKIAGLFHNIVEMIQFLCSNYLLAASHLGKSSQKKFALYLTMRNITRGEFVKNGGKAVGNIVFMENLTLKVTTVSVELVKKCSKGREKTDVIGNF